MFAFSVKLKVDRNFRYRLTRFSINYLHESNEETKYCAHLHVMQFKTTRRQSKTIFFVIQGYIFD